MKTLMAIILSGFVGACSVNPLQQQVTHLKTVRLVRHIRCEAQQAIITKADALLRFSNIAKPDHELLIAIADRLALDPAKYALFRASELPLPEEREFYNRYINVGVAFDFSFDITEQNTTMAELDPVGLISGGTLKVTLQSSQDLMRQNVRRFVVTNTFKELIGMKCDEHEGRSPPNLDYPIAGRIGLDELIDTFIDLNEEQALAEEKDDTARNTAVQAPVFADTLTFTTTLSGTVNPVLALNPVGRGLHLMDASLSEMAKRTDKHQVIVALAFPSKEEAKAPRRKRQLPRLARKSRLSSLPA